jgi:H+/Cl- antiporter ClcA
LTLSNGNNITSTSLDHRPTTVFNSDTSKVLLATATSTPVTSVSMIVEPVIGGIAASLVIAIAIVLVNIIIVCVYKKKISTKMSSDHGVETVTNEA